MLRTALLVVALCLPLPASAQTLDSTVTWVQGGPYRLKVAIYRAPAQATPPTLVVVLHGDSPFTKPSYQDRFAASVARTYPSTVVAAILRPGYTDPAGHTSDGERGEMNGDNWNVQNTEAIAAAITALRDQFHSPTVILVGHSGGAALSANILGRHPRLSAAAVLIACPCDVTAWRAQMYKTTKAEVFRGDLSTLSPMDLLSAVSPSVRIHMIVGERDDVTPPPLTLAYAAAAREKGLAVGTQVLPEQVHNILLLPEVLESLGPLVR